MAGVTIHANLISQILSAALDNRPLIKCLPEVLEWLLILIAAIFGATLCWVQRHNNTQKNITIVSIFLASCCLLGGSFMAFLAGWWIPVVPSLLALAGSAIAVTQYLAQSATEMRKTLGRYLTNEILANILETPSGLKLGESEKSHSPCLRP